MSNELKLARIEARRKELKAAMRKADELNDATLRALVANEIVNLYWQEKAIMEKEKER